jgi:hypothetical protein
VIAVGSVTYRSPTSVSLTITFQGRLERLLDAMRAACEHAADQHVPTATRASDQEDE